MPFKTLPKKANQLWEKVYNSSKDSGDSKETAAKKAWGAVKKSYKKNDNKWVKKTKKVTANDIVSYMRRMKK